MRKIMKLIELFYNAPLNIKNLKITATQKDLKYKGHVGSNSQRQRNQFYI